MQSLLLFRKFQRFWDNNWYSRLVTEKFPPSKDICIDIFLR